jgi:hypothetical protein
MGILRRWRNWFFWHVWHELGQRWYCWRHGVVRLGEAVRVHSITFGRNELLAGSVPGTVFSEQDLSGCDRVSLVEGTAISIMVENLMNRPVPFQGAVFVSDRHGATIYPFPPTLLGPRETACATVRLTGAGKLDRILIPTHVRTK